MKIAHTNSQLRQAICQLRQSSHSVGLVPTMGALHEGHLSLVDHSMDRCDATIVTIFVNPTQFSPDEDLQHYPRPLEHDLQLLKDRGVELTFVPDASEMYGAAHSTYVLPPSVSHPLEGHFRTGHFQGVATIVLKLINLTGADVAFFGQKDYQQSLVVRRMVHELNLPIQIVVCPIIRDQDGLALSSRNIYLDPEQRRSALSLSQSLNQAKAAIEAGEVDPRIIMGQMEQHLTESGVTRIDYAVVADANTLQIPDEISLPCVLLIAAHVGTTRLIDNTIIEG